MAIFSAPNFSILIPYMIMPDEYPVNWDVLIILHQGTSSQFIELKILVEKWLFMAQIPIFYIDLIWLCLTNIQLIGMRLFFYIKELLNKNSKNGHFLTKNSPEWPKFQFFYIDLIWLCLTSIQLIGICLFLYLKELRVDLLNKNSKSGHFSTKNGPKIVLIGQNSQFFILIQYDYALQVSS